MIRFLAVSKFYFFDTLKSVHTALVATVFPMRHRMVLENHPENFPHRTVVLRKERKNAIVLVAL